MTTPEASKNLGADSVKFTPDEVKELNASLSAIKVHGLRLSEAVLQFSGVEAPLKS